MATVSSERSGYRYVVVAVLALVYSLNFLDRQLLSILAEPVKADLSLSDTQLGLLTGFMFAIFYTAFGIPVAFLADRYRRVWIVSGACALWSLFSAACGLAQSFTQLALARMGVGIGEAGGSPPSYSIIADYFPPHQRGTALAFYSLGVPIGTTAGAAMGGWIAATHGWRAAFLAIGLPGLVVALVVLLTVREPARGGMDDALPAPQPIGLIIRAFLRDRTLVLVSLSSGASAFVAYGMISWMPAFLMRSKGMSLTDLALYYSLSTGAAAAVGTLAGGYLVDRLGARDPRMYAFVPAVGFAVALPFYMLAVAVSDWRVSIALIAVPFALYSTYLPAALAVVQNRVNPAGRSTASAILLFVLNIIGLGGGPLYVGMISDASTVAGTGGLATGLWALAPVFAIAALAHLAAARSLRNPVGS